MEDKYLNLGVRSFGCDFLVERIGQFYNHYKLPVVSVGSGMGVLEFLVKERYPQTNIICVDPAPTQWLGCGRKEPFLAPQYPFVKTLLEKEEELEGNCVLLLNWCCPNDSDYDDQAVKLLQPLAVLTLVEFYYGESGCAGGASFFQNYLLGKSSYEHVQVVSLHEHDQTIDHKDIRLIWLQRKGLSKVSVDSKESQLCKISHGEDCVIC